MVYTTHAKAQHILFESPWCARVRAATWLYDVKCGVMDPEEEEGAQTAWLVNQPGRLPAAAEMIFENVIIGQELRR